MDHFKAVITEPNRPVQKPDQYGTMHIPPVGVYYGVSLVRALEWARLTLPKLTEGAYCILYRIDEVEVEKMTREEAVSAAASATGSD